MVRHIDALHQVPLHWAKVPLLLFDVKRTLHRQLMHCLLRINVHHDGLAVNGSNIIFPKANQAVTAVPNN